MTEKPFALKLQVQQLPDVTQEEVNSQLKSLLKTMDPYKENLVEYLIYILTKLKKLDADIDRDGFLSLLETIIYSQSKQDQKSGHKPERHAAIVKECTRLFNNDPSLIQAMISHRPHIKGFYVDWLL